METDISKHERHAVCIDKSIISNGGSCQLGLEDLEFIPEGLRAKTGDMEVERRRSLPSRQGALKRSSVLFDALLSEHQDTRVSAFISFSSPSLKYPTLYDRSLPSRHLAFQPADISIGVKKLITTGNLEDPR